MPFFTMGNAGVYAETEYRMGQVARLIVEYFDAARRHNLGIFTIEEEMRNA
jgi:hypothetical protein